MPAYSFRCRSCDAQFLLVATVAEYSGHAETSYAAVACEACGNLGPIRDFAADVASQYTEKQQFWDDTAPEEVEGKGGFSRERDRILRANGLRQAETSGRKRTHGGTRTWTESEIVAGRLHEEIVRERAERAEKQRSGA